MVSGADIDRVDELIGSAAALTEVSFLETGRLLEGSIAVLHALTRRFEELQQELGGTELQQAADGLAEVAAQIAAATRTANGDSELLARLDALARKINQSIGRMRTEVGTIGVLTVNARIVSAGLGAVGSDFLGYIAEIEPSLKATRANLEQFDNELATVARQVGAARTSEARVSETGIETPEAEAVGGIPARMTAGIAVIGKRREGAAATAAAITERSRRISSEVGSAVMALQIGDATRQRIEHSQAAARQFRGFLQGEGLAAALDESGRHQLIAEGCRLEAALLSDAADDFDHQVGNIQEALRALSADAAEIVRLGTATFGSDDNGRSPFLSELEAEVARASQIFSGFRGARAKADGITGSVIDIATRLARNIGTVRSLEADIRIMGFNTTFKCSRLGDVGRPLAIISQELRACSGRTGAAAATVAEDIEAIAGTARELAGADRDARAQEIAGVAARMGESVDRLRMAGDSLAAALTALAAEGEQVAGILTQALSRMTAQADIAAALRAASEILDRIADSMTAGAEIADARQAMLAQMAARYTMAREREVHGRVTGSPVAAATETDLDDMLF